MSPIERATVVHFHRHRIAAHGPGTPEALGWKHADSQRLRFETIAEVPGFEDGCSVIDLGCGTGDLRAFLDERFRFPALRYLGLDQMPPLRRCRAPTSWWRAGRCATGVPIRRMFNVVARMYAAAERLFVFTLLDSAIFPEHPLLVGHDVDDMAAFCRGLAPRVDVIRGHAQDDVALTLRRRGG